MQQMRLRAVRRLPIAFGWLTKRGDAAAARWMRPVLTRPEIRRDTVRMLQGRGRRHPFPAGGGRTAPRLQPSGPHHLRPAGTGNAAEHGSRLAGLLPQGRLAEVDDSYTLIPLDQPARLARTSFGISATS